MDFLLADSELLAAFNSAAWLNGLWQFTKVLIGFSLIIFVHELGHFLAAKWCGVRVHRFAVGFGPRVFGWRSGEGLSFGGKPNYTPEELQERGYGETDYCLNVLPLGGYVKMMAESDFDIDDETGAIEVSDDPRAFSNRPVGARMTVVSAGVVFNLLFSAIAFMTVFLIGLDRPVPVIGSVVASYPADRAGLQGGDEIIAINGDQVDSWQDVVMKEVLTSGPMSMRIKRDGKVLPEPVVVEAEQNRLLNAPSIGAMQKSMAYVAGPFPRDAKEPLLKAGDKIIAINDQPIESVNDFTSKMNRLGGAPYEITVERKKDRKSEDVETVTATVPSYLMIRNDVIPVTREENMAQEPPNVLGFAPRVMVDEVTKNRPAKEAGIKEEDVIVRAGPIANPTTPEVFRVVAESGMQPVPITVLRDGKEITFDVTPEPLDRIKPWGNKTPFIGISPHWLEQDRVVVAQVIPDSPADEAGVPRGATIVGANGKKISTWTDFINVLFAKAGERVVLQVDSGGQQLDIPFEVPSSIVDQLDLPLDVKFLAINGGREIEIDGEKKTISSIGAIAAALRENIGKEIEIIYADKNGMGKAQTARFTVTEDNWQPWQLQVNYRMPLLLNVRPVLHKVDANGNPLRAIAMAGKVTFQNILATYQSMRQVAKQKVSTDNVSGPVGIFSIAMKVSEHGFAELLWLLGFLSANLAVINFLPLPVMDGGLMAFLILEKIRGKPVTVKTQMISTMVGLAVIGLIFIVVTFQDVAKLIP